MKNVIVHPCKEIRGATSIPGDKSISHRALMFASIAEGISVIHNLLEGHDCIATLQVMRSLGVHISLENASWIINGRGRRGLVEPSSILDCKNSGTTIRLMAGLLSAMPFMSILDGTDQVKSRPMDRVIAPLRMMNAKIFGRDNDRLAPLVTLPTKLVGTDLSLTVKSAQVKSAVILASLFADGKTTIRNTAATRDHTERLLSFMGAKITDDRDVVMIEPLVDDLSPISLTIPGDISSAAFLLVLGALKADDGIILHDVGVNETRTGIIDALTMMGAHIELQNIRDVANEAVADILVKKSDLRGATFGGDHIVRMIDEIPILALAAIFADGETVIRDASELKVKESNRITRTVESLQQLGADIIATDDGMIIKGSHRLHGGEVMSFSDHRLAMLLSIAGLLSTDAVTVKNVEVTDDSFPGFFSILRKLGANFDER